MEAPEGTVMVVAGWQPSLYALPSNPRCVLATDLESCFIACYDRDWIDAYTEKPIDSVITHWMELPDMPEE